jgi:hypothetical protein
MAMFESVIAAVANMFGARAKADNQRRRHEYVSAAQNQAAAAASNQRARSMPAGVVSSPTSLITPARDTAINVTDDGFTTSMLGAYATNSIGMGYAMGGNIAGAALGEALRPDPTPSYTANCNSSSSSSYDSSSSSSYDSSSSSSSYDSGSSSCSSDNSSY